MTVYTVKYKGRVIDIVPAGSPGKLKSIIFNGISYDKGVTASLPPLGPNRTYGMIRRKLKIKASRKKKR